MFDSKKKILSIITVTAIICFSLGFRTAKITEETDWVGFLVHGIKTHQVDPSIIVPRPGGFSPNVDGDIGLREDGVVVWKQVEKSQ